MKTHVLNGNTLNDFCINEIDYDNPYDFSVYHRHDYFELFLFDTGKGGEQNIDFVSYKISSKSMYFVTPGQVHLLNRKSGETGYLVQFTRGFLNFCLHPDITNVENIMRSLSEIKLTNIDFKVLQQEIELLTSISKSDSLYKNQKLKHQFALFVFKLLEVIKPNILICNVSSLINQLLEAVKLEIHKHRSVSYYANQLNVSVNNLAKETNKHLGQSPLKIIHKQLVLEIKRLMIFDDKSQKELADYFNFSDLSTYSRFVKSQTGLSPSDLKNSLMKIAKY